LLVSSIAESKVQHSFGYIALKQVLVDQSQKKTIPFAECRQKLNIGKITGIYEILKLSPMQVWFELFQCLQPRIMLCEKVQ